MRLAAVAPRPYAKLFLYERELPLPSSTESATIAQMPLAARNIAILLILIPVLAVATVGNQEIFNAYLVWAEANYQLVFFGRQMPVTWILSFGSIISAATIVPDRSGMKDQVAAILAAMTDHPVVQDIPLDVRATAFQARVWQALREIPWGQTRSYAELAQAVGQPTAVRAVARACASNPVAIAVPCHRVIGSDGSLTGYRWGVERKKRLLAMESKSH